MGFSQKLYEQVLVIFKPTEATSSVLDLILSLFTSRVITFESLDAQLPPFHAADLKHYLTSLSKKTVRALLQAQTSVLEP